MAIEDKMIEQESDVSEQELTKDEQDDLAIMLTLSKNLIDDGGSSMTLRRDTASWLIIRYSIPGESTNGQNTRSKKRWTGDGGGRKRRRLGARN